MLRRSLWAVFIVITFCFTTQALAVDVDYYHEGLGYINPNPADDEYAEGTEVELTAVAEPGWQFDGWEGAVTGTENPTRLVVSGPGPMEVQANFVIVGDLDASGKVDVADAIPALQAASGIPPASSPHVGADVNGNGKIDVAEAAHAFQVDAQLRSFQGPPSTGEYYNVGLEYDFFDDEPDSWLSLIELDGWGLLTVEDLIPDTGETDSVAYFINAEGSITITVSEGMEKYQFHGFSADDARHFVIANTTPLPGIDYGIKKSSGMSRSMLNGEYLMIEFKYERDFIDYEPIAIVNLVTFTGAGRGTAEELAVSQGEPDTDTVNFGYSVATDGYLTVTPDGAGFSIYGAVSSDGNTFSLLLHSPPDEVGILVGIKKSTSAVIDLLDGDYIYAGIEHDTADDDVSTSRGLLSMLNGSGTQRNLTESGAVYPAVSNYTYSVDTDGTVTIDTGEGTIEGIVSPDGETIMIFFLEETRPGFGLGIKKTIP